MQNLECTFRPRCPKCLCFISLFVSVPLSPYLPILFFHWQEQLKGHPQLSHPAPEPQLVFFPSFYHVRLLWLSEQVLSPKTNGAELSYRQSPAWLGTAGCVEPPSSLLPKANSTFLHTWKQTGNHLSPRHKSNLSSKVNVFPTNNALHVWSTLKPQYL